MKIPLLLVICSTFEALNGQGEIVWTRSECREMMESCELLNGRPGSQGPRGPKGVQGPPGILGPPGDSGEPGDSGDSPSGGGGFAVKGQKGDRGDPGRKGSKGYAGADGEQGRLGSAGENGRPGLQGRKGQRGEAGPPGEGGDPGIGELNWKQCAFKPNINMQQGELHSCSFLKLGNSSSLLVTYQGDTHIGLCGSCCKTWRFTFDNLTCTEPGNIDAAYSGLQLVQRNETNTLPVFMHGSISGYCSSVARGMVRVGLTLDNCLGYPSEEQFVPTSIQPNSRIIIQEVATSQP